MQNAENHPRYRIERLSVQVEFDDGTAGEIEMADRLFGPAFEPLHDPNEFSKAFVDEFGAVAWPCGATWPPMRSTGD